MMPSHPDDGDALQLQPDPDKLFRYHRQQLSAMLDGELSPDQARFMLRRLDHDTELADCWARWQVCGDMLRGRHHALLPADFAAGVARAVADGAHLPDDVAATAGPVAGGRRAAGILRWGGGAALVASVAMVALLVGRQAQAPFGAEAEREQVAVAESAVDGPVLPSAPAPSEGSPALAQAAVETADGQPAGAIGSGALALAGASALAIAEVPRRDERRSRGQSQRAAVTRVQRRDEPVRVAATAGGPGPGPAAASPMTNAPARVATDLPTLAMDASAGSPRPWPRAGFGAISPFAASYGAADAAPSFHPFEPRIGGASPRSPLGVSVAAPAWGTPATAIGTRRFEAPAHAPADPLAPHIE